MEFGSPVSHTTETPRVGNTIHTKTSHRAQDLSPTMEEEPSSETYPAARPIIRPTTQLELAEEGQVIGLPDEISGIETVLRKDVRKDWIDATFGTDFFPTSEEGVEMAPVASEQKAAARQGVGLSRIESYVAYTAVIPPGACWGGIQTDEKDSVGDAGSTNSVTPKIGVTLSRIPIGLYVRTVDVKSEAYAAGIVPGSVLIDINGLGILGEPTSKALERMWQYEGHFAAQNKSNELDFSLSAADSNATGENGEDAGSVKANSSMNGAEEGGIQGPVALRFIKDGKVYTAILMTKAPFGISWAPVGNFALVQRAYSFAADAGVRRGCLVAAVNGTSFRDMDHADTAGMLKDLFSRGEKITLTLAYTPAASRTGHHERAPSIKTSSMKAKNGKVASNGNASRPTVVKNGDVEVKIHPLEYSLGNFLSCGANRMPISQPNTKSRQQGGVSDLANRVASGEVLTNLGGSVVAATYTNQYSPCPSLPKEHIVSKWDALDALIYCIRFHMADYSEEKFSEIGGVFTLPNSGEVHSPNNAPLSGEKLVAFHTPDAYTEFLRGYSVDANAADAFDAYLMQMIGILSSPDLLDQFDIYRSAAADPLSAQRLSENILDIILNVAVESDDLSQRLYFLLRSFITSPEESKSGDSFPSHASNSKNCFSPLKVLLNAQQRLLSRIIERAPKVEERPLSVAPSSSSLRSGVSSSIQRESSMNASPQKMSSPPNRYSQNEAASRTDVEQNNGVGLIDSQASPKKSDLDMTQQKPKKKSMSKKLFRVFRGSSKESKRDAISDTQGMPTASAENNETADDSQQNEVMRNENVPQTASEDQLISLSLRSNDEDSIPSVSKKKPLSILRNNAPSLHQVGGLLNPLENLDVNDFLPTSTLFDNMSSFLSQLDTICAMIEQSLLKSVSQKIKDWALQPWSPSKKNDLERVTAEMRDQLRKINEKVDQCDNINTLSGDASKESQLPLMNPVNSCELLVSIDPEKSYIIPSAHFPLLLSFNTSPYQKLTPIPVTPRVGGRIDDVASQAEIESTDSVYKVRVEVLALRGPGLEHPNIREGLSSNGDSAYTVHVALAGRVQETGRSTLDPHFGSTTHCWCHDNILCFDGCSSWGPPETLSLKVSSVSLDDDGYDQVVYTDEKGMHHYSAEVGYCWADLAPAWDKCISSKTRTSTITCYSKVWSCNSGEEFDQHGEPTGALPTASELELELRVTTETITIDRDEIATTSDAGKKQNQRQCMLLYKHDDDLRQEMLAVQFVNTCDRMLKASGLDLQISTFRCLSAGANSGFIEWVQGSVALSEICKPPGSSSNEYRTSISLSEKNDDSTIDESVSTQEPTSRPGDWCKYESLRSLRQSGFDKKKGVIGLNYDNPIQDFLRSTAYDLDAPYFIKKDVMDTYVKSCAGYCVITYLLGVGDRHLDNILLHPKGHFLHCDYSFILGQDPKTYLPMRITKEMVLGMGGQESDNFAMFLSYAGAAFLALRRHNNLRTLLSLVRNMVFVGLPDVSKKQRAEDAIMDMRERFRLDLNENEAVSFIEKVIEMSIASKMWLAVDTIHSLGKRF